MRTGGQAPTAAAQVSEFLPARVIAYFISEVDCIHYHSNNCLGPTREMPHSEGGPCCAVVGEEDDGSPQLCGETWSTCWYGKKGKKFCAGHRAAWNHWRHSGDADEEVEHSTLTELVGVRYC